MATLYSLAFLNNFSIKTSRAITNRNYQVIPCELDPSLDDKDFILTLTNEDGSLIEIVSVTYMTDTDLDVSGFEIQERGMEGTVAQPWPEGTKVYCSITADTLGEIVSDLSLKDQKMSQISNIINNNVLEVHFLFDTARGGTGDKITSIRKENFVGSNYYTPINISQLKSPNYIFVYDNSGAMVLSGASVKKARVSLPDRFGMPYENGEPMYMKISVTGARAGYSGPCETAQPCTIRIVANGTVFGEEIVTWPAKGATAEYHIEYQNY